MAGIHDWDKEFHDLPALRAAAGGAPSATFDASDEREEAPHCPVTQALMAKNYSDLNKYQVTPSFMLDNAEIIDTNNYNLIYNKALPLAKAYQDGLLGLKRADPEDFYGKSLMPKLTNWSPKAREAILMAARTPMNAFQVVAYNLMKANAEVGKQLAAYEAKRGVVTSSHNFTNMFSMLVIREQGYNGSEVMWMLKYGMHPDSYRKKFTGDTTEKRYKQRTTLMNETVRDPDTGYIQPKYNEVAYMDMEAAVKAACGLNRAPPAATPAKTNTAGASASAATPTTGTKRPRQEEENQAAAEAAAAAEEEDKAEADE